MGATKKMNLKLTTKQQVTRFDSSAQNQIGNKVDKPRCAIDLEMKHQKVKTNHQVVGKTCMKSTKATIKTPNTVVFKLDLYSKQQPVSAINEVIVNGYSQRSVERKQYQSISNQPQFRCSQLRPATNRMTHCKSLHKIIDTKIHSGDRHNFSSTKNLQDWRNDKKDLSVCSSASNLGRWEINNSIDLHDVMSSKPRSVSGLRTARTHMVCVYSFIYSIA